MNDIEQSTVHTPAQRRWRLARRVVGPLWWVALACLLLLVASRSLLDLEVYRNGGLAWLRGIPLYVDFPGPLPGPRLPFTYPPLAAVLFTALAGIPLWLANAVVTAAGFVALTAVCVLVAGRLAQDKDVAWTVGLGASVAAIFLEPVLDTLHFGQVNLLLMGLVVIDCLAVRNPRWRGVLVGLAAAIKLTPAVFVLYFLLRRDWRAAVTAVVSFIGFGALGFALAAKESAEYWFHALTDPSRIGGLPYAANQSLRGVLERVNPGKDVVPLLWLGLTAAVMALAVVVALRAREDVVALLAIAAGGLLASPVSWSHHWVWCAPAFLVIAVRLRQWWQWGLFAAVVVVFCVKPFKMMPNENDRELLWTFWQHIPGDVYVWLTVGALLVLAVRRRSIA
ncbi:alpha-1,2-mannosyltransferase [Crossiella equi]|uniref:Alpha-1,2-mannosyltransferase n=1 Tax=Crossiella equi TaxID=130796 RepID=A0ABS5APQ7_9PSEU|nr:glycosyltransferase 87 family protein [Crossiella equi]MBP2478416.1 alpha-1,2-mannosyltransferase [Crossiella equi]